MSLLPLLFNDSYTLPPTKILDQYFALVLKPEDLQQPETVSRLLQRSCAGYIRSWRPASAKGDSGSTISFDKEMYRAVLDVQQFGPEELSVKVTGGNTVIIEGKHGEKVDEQGKIHRQFVRRYILPKNCDMDKVESKLSSDGMLIITAPRVGENQVDQKNISIIQTGEPAREIEKVEEKCEEDPEKKCEKSLEKTCEKSPVKECE